MSSGRHEFNACRPGWDAGGIDGPAARDERAAMRLSRTSSSSHWHFLILAGLASCGLTGCSSTKEKLDTMWLTIDPAGHHRYHKDKYYPHERRTGLRLPKE